MWLSLGLLEWNLAKCFGVCEATVSRILVGWINYMYLRLGSLLIWPSVQRDSSVFIEGHPTTFRVIDATEVMCEVPVSLSLQLQCYSNYKSHTAMKGLLAVAPNGAIIFVSELFMSSVSDRQLVAFWKC